MRLDDLAVRGMDGSALVEGELAIYTAPDEAVVRASPGCLIGVNCRRKGFGSTSFSVYDKTSRGPDGFYGAGPPLLHVDFEEAVPDLIALLSRAHKGSRQRIASEQFRVITARLRTPTEHEGGHRDRYVQGNELDLMLGVEDGGLRIAFESVVRPSTLIEQALAFSEAKLVGNVLLPAAYCRLQGFHMLGLRDSDREVVGGWTPSGTGLGSVAVNSSAPFCPGFLDWQEKPSPYRPAGPFVLLYLREHELIARPTGALNRLANGFASETRYLSDGPELNLFMGVEDWSRMLGQNGEAEIDQVGAGLGHVDGQTGRSVHECGGYKRQAINRLRLRLKRSSEGLVVSGRGELAPLARGEGSTSLGPKLQFEFMVPRAWILARGLKLPGFWEDRKKEFPSADTW